MSRNLHEWQRYPSTSSAYKAITRPRTRFTSRHSIPSSTSCNPNRNSSSSGTLVSSAHARLRSFVSGILAWLVNHQSGGRDDTVRIAGIIAAFTAGAVVGALATRHMGAQAGWLPAAALIALLALIRRPRSDLLL
jgi:Protein of unknown function (DUF1275)